jgi:hypothetical protein
VTAALLGIVGIYLAIQITALILHAIGASSRYPSNRPIGTHHAKTDLLMRLGTDLNFIACAFLLLGLIYLFARLRSSRSRAVSGRGARPH